MPCLHFSQMPNSPKVQAPNQGWTRISGSSACVVFFHRCTCDSHWRVERVSSRGFGVRARGGKVLSARLRVAMYSGVRLKLLIALSRCLAVFSPLTEMNSSSPRSYASCPRRSSRALAVVHMEITCRNEHMRTLGVPVKSFVPTIPNIEYWIAAGQEAPVLKSKGRGHFSANPAVNKTVV